MPDQFLKILLDLYKGRVHWLEIPAFISWFLFDQKREEIRNDIPWTIN